MGGGELCGRIICLDRLFEIRYHNKIINILHIFLKETKIIKIGIEIWLVVSVCKNNLCAIGYKFNYIKGKIYIRFFF